MNREPTAAAGHGGSGGRRRLKFLVKVLVSALLLWLLVRSVDFEALLDASRGLSAQAIWGCFLALLAQALLAAWRWNLVLEFLGIRWRFAQALKVTLIGLFFNQTLPSTIGGDAVRSVYVRRGGAGVGMGVSVISVLLDRLAGLATLLLISLLSAGLVLDMITDPAARYGLLLVLGAGLSAVVAVYHLHRMPNLLRRLKMAELLRAWSQHVRRLVRRPARLSGLLLLSVAVHLITIFCMFLLARELGIGLRFVDFCMVVPPVLLLAMVPVSVAGWGVREGSMAIGLGLLGVQREPALVLSVLFGVEIAMVGLAGGLVWLFDRSHPRLEQVM